MSVLEELQKWRPSGRWYDTKLRRWLYVIEEEQNVSMLCRYEGDLQQVRFGIEAFDLRLVKDPFGVAR